MSQTRPVQNTFSSGELDPLLAARNDFQRFQTGLSKARGFLPLRQGGFTRAPGTIHRGSTRADAVARRIPFRFAANDAVELEFSDQIMRVWRYGALVLSGGSPYELSTPYLEADLPNLDWVQDGDVVLFADGRQPIQRLARTALDNWSIGPATFSSGPFLAQNLDEAKTVQASAETGAITLTGVGDVFDPDHVGALFHIVPTDYKSIPNWVGNIGVSANSFVRFGGHIYELTAGTNTGLEPPVHTTGAVKSDPSSGAEWTYVCDEFGIVRISSVTNANLAQADVLKRLPAPVVSDPTYRWSEGAWSDVQGYPAAVERYQRRLFAAASASSPRTVWASTIGALTDFEPGTAADSAFAYAIDSDGDKESILWLQRGRNGIYLGGLSEVQLGYSAEAGQAIGPTTFAVDPVSQDGAAAVRPVKPYGWPLYVTRDGARVQEIRYSFQEDDNRPVELSLPSQHLGGVAIEQVVWQSAPFRTAWARRADGALVAMVHDPDQDVLGWAVVPMSGGFVEDMAVSPSADGAYDVLTMIVRRDIDGTVKRFVEEQANNIRPLLGTAPLTEFVHTFASVEIADSTPFSAASLPHLPDQTLCAWTDKGMFRNLSSDETGAVVLPEVVTSCKIGLVDNTHYAETLNLIAPARDGDARGRRTRLHSGCGVQVYQAAGGYVRSVEHDYGSAPRLNPPQALVPRVVALDIREARSGVARIDVPSGHSEAVRLRFEADAAAPLTVLSITPNIEEAGP